MSSAPTLTLAISLTLTFGVASGAVAQPAPIDLGTLGGSDSRVQGNKAMNAGGSVVGASEIRLDTNTLHAFWWTLAGGMLDLGTLGGGYSIPAAVNDSDQVVGYSETAQLEIHAFSWTLTGGTTLTAGMIDLGTLGGDSSEARDVNKHGQVVGESSNDRYHRAFSWTPTDGMVDLGSLGGTSSTAWAVNDNGQVVGVSSVTPPCNLPPHLCPDTVNHAFSWTVTGGMVDLTPVGYVGSAAYAVNNNGQVVGDIYTTDFPPSVVTRSPGRRRMAWWIWAPLAAASAPRTP